MTLGLFLVIATAFTALVEIAIFTRMRNNGRLSEAIYPVVIMASLSLPVIVYVIMFHVMPDTGASVLF
ncbi:hypothetical protein SAMN06297468_2979 [Altererythrobacter xiamenensis]|uniref:Tripartite ATP-independent transporter, DctM component n=1 Tax=Altererythrobacter xiamenensis TaxID=1316679 RepID=A0A1Y6FLL6_9SPHN|nr:hypothetical protein [Altererythrobacter xiamenensis]SMQ75828.1 hypothetical protein SAMN06297468_2979 [Altererythrobacter xiamenensis]